MKALEKNRLSKLKVYGDEMKILVSDNLHKAGIGLLKKAADVEVATGLEEGELIKKIEDKDAILVRSATKVTADVIGAAKNLKVIGRAGIGVDNIDLKAATRRGIVVVNAPGASTTTVAEHTIGLILSLARNIPFADASLKSGRWEKKKFLGQELRGKTLGVIGTGRIGSHVIKKAKAFEMNIIAYDPYVSQKLAKSLGIEIVSLNEIYKRSDFITVHVPLTDQTRHIINKKAISKMKKGVCIVNCARGGVVDEDALLDGLESGKVGGAALDVFEREPAMENPLLKHERFIATPHLGASTEEAQRYASTIACEEVIKVLQNKPALNVVNMPGLSAEAMETLGDYIGLANLLGGFCVQLLKGSITNIHVTYCGKLADDKGSNILTNSIIKGLLSPILTGGVNLLNASILAKNRGIKITESKREEVERFDNMIILDVKAGRYNIQIKGSVVGEEKRIVGIERYSVDLIPRGKMLLVKHEDRPGMIGKVATLLGDGGINIGAMQVGRKKVGGTQLMVLSVDHDTPKKILDAIKGIKGVKKVEVVEL